MGKIVVYNNDENGIDILIPVLGYDLTFEEIVKKDVPNGKEFIILDSSDLPKNNIFRNAWVLDSNNVIIDLEKSKTISHEIRRYVREIKFKPLDELIMKQIPNIDLNEVENKRQKIRDEDTLVQLEIDKSIIIDELYLLVENILKEITSNN